MNSIKKKIDNSIPHIIEKLGCFVNPVILNFKNENSRLLIFYFHGLYNSLSQKELNHVDPQNNITVNQLIEFIDYFLVNNYIFVRPEDLSGNLQNDKSYAMITFDDGYYNNNLAVNILNKYKIPATLFVTTRNIFETKSFWWDIIYKYRKRESISLESIRQEQSYLKKYKYPDIEKYIEQNFGKRAFDPWSDIDRPFSKSELLEISQNPFISIGNHTHNHAILTNYSDEEVRDEFITSNKLLLDLLGSKPNTVAFPNGNFNNSILNIAQHEGFKYAFTTQNDINKLPISDNNKIISLNRFMVKTSRISKYGSFIRLNYSSDVLYSSLKKWIIS